MSKKASVQTCSSSLLAPYACHPEQSRGRLHKEEESRFRTAFQRDRDRIIHSGAFRKLQHKTQVFVYHVGDYYRSRLTHSLEVAQIARTLCRRLRLNEDFAEAVALAHDLGHTPFGHTGEEALNEKMQNWDGFRHNDQTLRILTKLEQRYAAFDGLNLSWEILEGVAKHNGPVAGSEIGACLQSINENWDLELDSYSFLEAQIAALADDIAYINHDLDDGLRAGLLQWEGKGGLLSLDLLRQIYERLQHQYQKHDSLHPRRLRHEFIRVLIGTMVEDLLQQIQRNLEDLQPNHADAIRFHHQPIAEFSENMAIQVKTIRQYLFTHLYRHYVVNRETSKARRVVASLFDIFFSEPNCLPAEWQIAPGGAQSGHAGSDQNLARQISDYIAGMTDRYAYLEYARLFDPRHISR